MMDHKEMEDYLLVLVLWYPVTMNFKIGCLIYNGNKFKGRNNNKPGNAAGCNQ